METLWALFTAKCQSILDNHVPTKLSSQRYNQPWANGKIRNLSRKKKKYYKKAQRTRSDQDMAKYQATKKLVQSECRKAYYQYINSMIGESNQNGGNLKKFWSFIKSKKNDNSGVAPLKKNGIVHSDSQTKADILNTQFSTVFMKGGKINCDTLPDITVCETGVRKLLEAVKPHKATGPDAIPARLLKDYAAEIAPVLTLIYQSSLDQGTVPVENLNILTDYQHGFRKRRSFETQLIQTVDDLAKSLHDAGQIDAVLLDFSKAFDKVSHPHLAAKLHHYGMRGNTLDWIQSFLSNRTQEVVLEGKRSFTAAVTLRRSTGHSPWPHPLPVLHQ